MTEDKRLAAEEFARVLKLAAEALSFRRLTLLNIATARRKQLPDDTVGDQLLRMEGYADGAEYPEECIGVFERLRTQKEELVAEHSWEEAAAARDYQFAFSRHPPFGIYSATVLREFVGYPFRPITFSPAWRTSTITSLAAAVYEDRRLPSGLFDNGRLAVLANALEDAGCDNADILGHLRGGGEHVRGCWAVDLILGKE